MGKSKKFKGGFAPRHDPLYKQISESRYAQASSRNKSRRTHQEEEEFVDDKLTKKILTQARIQQEELEEEVGFGGPDKKSRIFPNLNNDDDDEDDDTASLAGSDFMEEIHINPEDEKALENFMCKDPARKATLADIIKEKLTEKQTEIHTIYSDAGSIKPEDLERIGPLYKGVAKVLSQYRSGKLPKAFKVIPKFSNWEQILHLTEPDRWTAASMYQATRIFAANLKENMAQRFYNLVLLPRLRDDIAECKTLNVHLYHALKKSLFKPGAFFKGILLPLCESGDCTLRETTIFGSVMAKRSIPNLHSSAALLRIAEMKYSGTNSIFMRVLLQKKYNLPYRVVDGVVNHFLGFASDRRPFPLLWHHCLLTFAQLYKNDLSHQQQKDLLHLLTIHSHAHVTPEIRRELLSSTGRSTKSIAAE